MESLVIFWLVVLPLIIVLVIWGLSVYQQGFYNNKKWVPSFLNVWWLRLSIGSIIASGVIYTLDGLSSKKLSQISGDALFSSIVSLVAWFIFNYLNGIKSRKRKEQNNTNI